MFDYSRTELEQKLLMLDVGFNQETLAQLPDRALQHVLTAISILRVRNMHPTDKRAAHAMMKGYDMPGCPLCGQRFTVRKKSEL